MFSKIGPKKKDQKHVETSLIEEFYYPKYGPGQLWETAAEEVRKMGGTIQMHSKVTQIHTDAKGKVLSLTYEKDGKPETIEGDIFLSSMPVKDLVAGMNDVPAEMAKIAAGLPYRDFRHRWSAAGQAESEKRN